MDAQLSRTLNIARWSAALMVVASHLRSFLFVDFSETSHASIFVNAFYAATSFGHEAVMIFFVISGLLVGGLNFEKWRSGRFSMERYIAHRTTRIYLVLLPALALGYLFDKTGLMFFNQSGIYSGLLHAPPASLQFSIDERLNAMALFASTTMLQPFYFTSFGSNGPLWSLSYEWWYYSVFALSLYVAQRTTKFRAIGLMALALAMIGWVISGALVAWALIWVAGGGVLLYRDSTLPKPNAYVAGISFLSAVFGSKALLASSFFIHFPRNASQFLSDALISITFCALLASLPVDTKKYSMGAAQRTWGAVSESLADFSYSVYLFHFPFALLLTAALDQQFGLIMRQQPNLRSFLAFAAIIFVTYTFCFCVSCVTERKTDTIRLRITKSLVR